MKDKLPLGSFLFFSFLMWGGFFFFAPSIDTAEELANRVENANLLRLVIGYRTFGHRRADLDPLKIVQAE